MIEAVDTIVSRLLNAATSDVLGEKALTRYLLTYKTKYANGSLVAEPLIPRIETSFSSIFSFAIHLNKLGDDIEEGCRKVRLK